MSSSLLNELDGGVCNGLSYAEMLALVECKVFGRKGFILICLHCIYILVDGV